MGSNIHEAMLEVYANVEFVKKEFKQGLGYSYAGESAIIDVLRPEMVKAGITVSVDSFFNVNREVFTTSKGSAMNRVTLEALIRFTHAASTSSIVVSALGEGMDSGDKATNKAMTGALKYALRQTFCLETGDDPDKDSSKEQQRGTVTVRTDGPNVRTNKDTTAAATVPAQAKLDPWEGAEPWMINVRDSLNIIGMKLMEVPSIKATKGRSPTEALTRWALNHASEESSVYPVLILNEAKEIKG
jgi:hypothetical protein